MPLILLRRINYLSFTVKHDEECDDPKATNPMVITRTFWERNVCVRERERAMGFLHDQLENKTYDPENAAIERFRSSGSRFLL